MTLLWIFFRASSLDGALDYLGGFFDGLARQRGRRVEGAARRRRPGRAAVILIDLVDRNRERIRPLAWSPVVQGALFGVAVVAMFVWSGRPPEPVHLLPVLSHREWPRPPTVREAPRGSHGLGGWHGQGQGAHRRRSRSR